MSIKKIATLILSVMLVAAALSTTALAADTQTYSIELTTRSILIVDRSGSMEEIEKVDDLVSQLDQSSYDAVAYFDDGQLSVDPEFEGGGNSSICEQIAQLADAGFTHISVVTDAEQWPAQYEALGLYTDIDLTIYMVEEIDEEAEEFLANLQSRMFNSNLKVVKLDGSEENLLDDYQAPIYDIEIEIPEKETVIIEKVDDDTSDESTESESDTSEDDESSVVVVGEENCDHECLWWLALVLAILLAMLFDFIHELLTKNRTQDTGSNGTATASKPYPPVVVNAINSGEYRLVADYSGSMAGQHSETQSVCEQAGIKDSVICFGEQISEHQVSELSSLSAQGQTHGWEAIEEASKKGWEKLMLISDLHFNGKAFDQSKFSKKFQKIMVVTPSNYNQTTLEELKKITDEIEVVSL